MSDQTIEHAKTLLDKYIVAFDTIDGANIAALYNVPTLTIRGDGSIHTFNSTEEIAKFFQGVVDSYYEQGYRTGRYVNLSVSAIGTESILATMTWEMLRGDGSLWKEWNQSYNLVRSGDSWKFLVSTIHR